MRLGLLIPVVQAIEQAVEGRIRHLELGHGGQSVEGDGANPVTWIGRDFGTKPRWRLEFTRGVIVLERYADQIEWSRGEKALDGGGIVADADRDAQILDLSGGQTEQGFGLGWGNRGGVLARPLRGLRDEDQVAALTCHPHVGAAVGMVEKVALADEFACPLPLDQPGQAGGQQKDTDGTHRSCPLIMGQWHEARFGAQRGKGNPHLSSRQADRSR